MSELFSSILGKKFIVSNPFFSKTKSDVVKTLREYNSEELISTSRSCTRTLGSTRLHSHCGTCSQCIERRLAMLHNEMEEFDPEEMYSTNLFLGPLEVKEDRMMVEDYIRHARLLEEIDIDSFFERFPDSYELVSELNLSPVEGAYLMYDLHRRHGLQAAKVINSQIGMYSDSIRKGETSSKSLLGMILSKSVSITKKTELPKVFPTSEGARWEDIVIEIISNESVRVKLGSLTRRYTGFDIGFTDGRRIDRLDRQWELLKLFAEKNGEISKHTMDFLPKIQKSVQALNRKLRAFFRMNSNPIDRYSKEHGWRSKFQIADKSFGSPENDNSFSHTEHTRTIISKITHCTQ